MLVLELPVVSVSDRDVEEKCVFEPKTLGKLMGRLHVEMHRCGDVAM